MVRGFDLLYLLFPLAGMSRLEFLPATHLLPWGHVTVLGERIFCLLGKWLDKGREGKMGAMLD